MNIARADLRHLLRYQALCIAAILMIVATTLMPSAAAQGANDEMMSITQAVPGAVLDISISSFGLVSDLAFLDDVRIARPETLTAFTVLDSSTAEILFGPTDLALPAGVRVSVFVHPIVGGGVTASVMEWDPSPTTSGQGRLLVAHGADLPVTDVTIEGDSGYSTTTQLGNGQSIVLDVPPDTYTISFTLLDDQVKTWRLDTTRGFMVAAWVTGVSETGLLVAQLRQPIVVPATPPSTSPFASAHSLRHVGSGVVDVFDSPDGQMIQAQYEYLDGSVVHYPLVSPTYFGNALTLAVTQGAPNDEWAEVLLPVRPQGTTGWVETDQFEWRFHDKTVHVFLEDTTLLVANALGPIWEAPVVIGRPATPVPTGKTYVDEVLTDAGPIRGPYLFSLAMFSEATNSIAGGLPKISIHGSRNPHYLGTAQNGGATQLSFADAELMHALLGPNVAGTPTTIWPSRAAFDAAIGGTTCGGRTPTVDLALGQIPTAGDDVIIGTPGDDAIVAGAGNDVICGLGGNDRIWGQGGNDVIHGGDGDDKIRGGDGLDTIYGDDGADDLNGGRDNDKVRGGAGADVAVRGGTGDDVVLGDDGDDLLVAGNGGADVVIGGAGNDKVTGGPRPDTVAGGSGNDDVKGNKGADFVFGDDGDDMLFGGPQPDVLNGGNGNDTCNGGTEPDELAAATCQSVIAIP